MKILIALFCVILFCVSVEAQTVQTYTSDNGALVRLWFSEHGIFHIDGLGPESEYGTTSYPSQDMNIFSCDPLLGNDCPRLLLEPNYDITTLYHNQHNFITFAPSNGVARIRADNSFWIEIANPGYSGTIVSAFDKIDWPDATGFMLWDSNSRTVKRVHVGPPDSCGQGQRCLTIDN